MVVELQDPERVRYVAANYERLQGLFRVLVGVLVLLAWAVVISPLGDVLASPRAADFITTGNFLTILAGGAAFLLIRNWYGRRYGRVRTGSRFSVRHYLTRIVAVFAMLMIVAAIGSYTGILQDETGAYLFFLAIRTGDVASSWPEKQFRWYYMVFGTLMILAGVLLAFGMLPDNLTLNLLAGFMVLHLVVGGLLDHLLLVRTLKFVLEE